MILFKRILIVILIAFTASPGLLAQDETDSLNTASPELATPDQNSIRKVSLTNLQSPMDETGESVSEATLVYNTNPEIGTGLYYWNGSVWAQVMADDDGDPEANSAEPAKTKEFLEALAKLIGALAWPGTLLVILFLFRRGFAGAIKRIGGFKVDSSGISLDFNDEIAAVKDVLGGLKQAATAKSAGQIQTKATQTPFVQLVNLKSEISDALDRRARAADLAQGPGGIENRLDQLVGHGQMDNTQAEMVRSLTGLIDKAKRDVTQQQVDQIESLYKEIEL